MYNYLQATLKLQLLVCVCVYNYYIIGGGLGVYQTLNVS